MVNVGLRVKIKNKGHRDTSLSKITALMDRRKNNPFSPNINEFTLQDLPMKITSMDEERINILFDLSLKMREELEKNLPIKVKIKFEFTHAFVDSIFMVGRKGIFWKRKRNRRKVNRY